MNLEVYSVSFLQDFLTLSGEMKKYGLTPESIKVHIEEMINEENRYEEKIILGQGERQKEWLAKAPKCPVCSNILRLRPIKLPQGPKNRNGYKSLWYCIYGDCTYEEYTYQPFKKIIKQLEKKILNLRIDSDFKQATVPAKVKDAELMKIPYIIVVGDKEEKEKNLAVRVRGDKKIKSFEVDEFGDLLKKEISERK